MPYLAVGRIALDRIALLAAEQAGPADADFHPG
jgi:hypothetical protein